jgi:chemotaxis protein methyltransferase CheR
MNDALRALAQKVEALTGIWLERGGRLRSLAGQLGDGSEPRASVASLGREGCELINAVTVNHTWFFRDGEQMQVLARLLCEGWPAGQPIHIWIPGCSTGEDAYSLALLAAEAGRPADILATDINTVALRQADQGSYGAWTLRELPKRFGARLTAEGKQFRVDAALRGRVRFEWHNLVEPPPRPEGNGGWDLIVCRNVLIYFRLKRAIDTLRRLGAALRPGGWLFLGSSEVVYETPERMELVQLGPRVALKRMVADASPASRRSVALPRLASPQIPVPARLADRRPCAGPAALVHAPRGSGAFAMEQGLDPAMDAGAALEEPYPEAVRCVSEGNALLDAGEAARALERYAQAQGFDPLFGEAHFFSGVALHLLDDPQRAADALRGALLLCPGLWPASFYLALCYQSLGLERDAGLEYERLLATVEQPVQLHSRGRLVSELHAWKQEVRLLARKRLLALSHRAGARTSVGRAHGT